MLSTVADVRTVEARAHGLIGLVSARPPAGGAFQPLIVVNGSVRWSDPGSLPCRTCTVRVMGFDNQGRQVTDYVSQLGSWIRLAHRVVRPGGATFDVPLGTYRVDRISVDELAGVVDIEGSDVGSLVADYGLVLNAGQVLTTTNYGDAAATMLNAVLAGIPAWWTSGGVSTVGVPAVKPATRLQYVGSRVDAVTELATGAGVLVATPIDDSYAFRLQVPTSPHAPAVVTIRPGPMGNMVSHVHAYDREGLANVALVEYTVQSKSGTKVVTTQKRLQIEYVQAGADVRAGGPFGRVTIDVDATNVTTDAQASSAAQDALKSRLSNTSDIALNIGPIYGLEPGDPVRVERADGTATPGQVVGATIGLTAADAWSVTVRSFVSVVAGTFSLPRVVTAPVTGNQREGVELQAVGSYDPHGQTVPRDATDWFDFPATVTDLTGNTAAGWIARMGSVQDGGSRLQVVADGVWQSPYSPYLTLVSVGTFSLTEHKRIRVMASVFAGDQDINVSTVVQDPSDPTHYFGANVQTVLANSSALVVTEVDLGVNGPEDFVAGVQCGVVGSGATPAGLTMYVSNVVVQWADPSPWVWKPE